MHNPDENTAGSVPRTKLALTFTSEESRNGKDFRFFALDAAGKRHQANNKGAVWGAVPGKGINMSTFVLEFNLAADEIKHLVIQRRVNKQ